VALTAKQQRFVAEYLLDLNATQAAIRAGYSRKTARQIGTENLAKPALQEAIQAGMASRSVQTGIDQQYVLQGLRREAEFAGKGCSHAARVTALGLLGKHLGMFRDKIEHSGSVVQTHVYLPAKDGTKPA
jgi:phage terminase small subunit